MFRDVFREIDLGDYVHLGWVETYARLMCQTIPLTSWGHLCFIFSTFLPVFAALTNFHLLEQ